MTSPIDPIRRAARLRRGARPEPESAEEAHEAERANLPVPMGAPRTVPPADEPQPAAAAFGAQLLGQDGQKRGLRAGPAVIVSAQSSYNQVEWSGAKDRRARKGRIAKTEI
jgi:hypothetical protein